MIENQIFIFSNFYESHLDFPDEFKASYSKWLKEIEVTPSKYRFLNSNREVVKDYEYYPIEDLTLDTNIVTQHPQEVFHRRNNRFKI